jgi:hypothetical protein
MTTEEMQTATPAEQVTAEQVQQDASNSSESSTEQTQDVQQEQTQEQTEQAKKEPWFQKRIGELTREKYEARRAAEEAQREAQQYREYLARVQQGEQMQQQPEVDVRTLAQQEAARMVADQRFRESTDKVWNQGVSELPGFNAAVANLQMVGMDRQFVELAVESDAGHKVLHYLGQEQNLDEAARILRLPPVQQARELTKLEFKLNQPPPPKPVSKAPDPIKPIGAGGATDTGLRDDLPIDEWMRRNAKRK